MILAGDSGIGAQCLFLVPPSRHTCPAMRVGDQVQFVNGAGRVLSARVVRAAQDWCVVQVETEDGRVRVTCKVNEQGKLSVGGLRNCVYCGDAVQNADLTLQPPGVGVPICDECKNPSRCPVCRHNVGHAPGCVWGEVASKSSG